MRAFIVAATLLAASPLFTAADKPTFSPSTVSGVFVEQFTADWDERWSPSEATKEEKSGEEVFSYVGNWSVEEPSILPGIQGDKGLVVKSAAAHHAISAPFASALDNTGKTLVVQYEVKLQDGLECGGAYLKLLTQSPKGIQAAEYSDKTPYTIMFGPDKCGMTNKVHFIFRHKNPKTGEYEEKHLKTPPSAKIVKTSTLYTLVVKPDNTFDILINNESAKAGSLLEDFDPAVNPEKEIDDPKDTKPEDWVDEARITDPDATKPDDWDEDAAFEIIDEDAEKPDDWYEDEPATIPDPDAEKPEDWDDEEDGDWIPPQVPNPKCADAAGCGPWKKPMKKNPAYKGKWYAPMIDNPAYKGVWSPRKISNPDYFEDNHPSNFEKMAGIGYELWTMQKDILFDNIYIGHSVEDAKKFADETWKVKYDIETAAEDAEKPLTDEAMDSDALTFWDDPLMFVQKEVQDFIPVFLEDPLEALQTKKEVAGGLAAAFVTVLALIGALLALLTPKGSPLKESAQKGKKVVEKEVEKAKDAAKEAADKVTETAKSTAADVDVDQDGLKKRTK